MEAASLPQEAQPIIPPSKYTSEQHDKENIPETSPRQTFFKKRTITAVINKPKKKFVPPFLAGSLSKPSNINVLQNSTSAANTVNSGKTSCDNHATTPKKPAVKAASSCTPRSKSPVPGPSAYYIDNSDSVSESEDESSNCCVCGKYSPPALQKCTSLVIVKWAQCDKCQHWTHLTFCTDIRVVRRYGEFLCPHCQ
jgi:hypothetical protein